MKSFITFSANNLFVYPENVSQASRTCPITMVKASSSATTFTAIPMFTREAVVSDNRYFTYFLDIPSTNTATSISSIYHWIYLDSSDRYRYIISTPFAVTIDMTANACSQFPTSNTCATGDFCLWVAADSSTSTAAFCSTWDPESSCLPSMISNSITKSYTLLSVIG